jgi:hypothetical protein
MAKMFQTSSFSDERRREVRVVSPHRLRAAGRPGVARALSALGQNRLSNLVIGILGQDEPENRHHLHLRAGVALHQCHGPEMPAPPSRRTPPVPLRWVMGNYGEINFVDDPQRMTDDTGFRVDTRRGRLVACGAPAQPLPPQPWPTDELCRQILDAGGLLCGAAPEDDALARELRHWFYQIGVGFRPLEISWSRRKTWVEIRFLALWHYLAKRLELRWGEGEPRHHFARLCFAAFAPALPNDLPDEQKECFKLPDISDPEWAASVEFDYSDIPRRAELDRQNKRFNRACNVEPVPRPYHYLVADI